MAQHEKFYLNGTWQLKKADETLLCPVEIPGSVLSGLTEHGLLEDPFYRMNEYPTRELLKNDFIFSREFELKKEEGRVYALCCDGIDTVADIFINGMLIKHVDNMHLRYRILCTNVLKNGTNNITVKIHSAIEASRCSSIDTSSFFTAFIGASTAFVKGCFCSFCE